MTVPTATLTATFDAYAVVSRGLIVGAPTFVFGYAATVELAFAAADALEGHRTWGETIEVVRGSATLMLEAIPAARLEVLAAVLTVEPEVVVPAGCPAESIARCTGSSGATYLDLEGVQHVWSARAGCASC